MQGPVWTGVNWCELKSKRFSFHWLNFSFTICANCADMCEQVWTVLVWTDVNEHELKSKRFCIHRSNFSITICANCGNLCEQVWIGVNLKARGFVFTGWASVSPSVRTAATTCVNRIGVNKCEWVWRTGNTGQTSVSPSEQTVETCVNKCEQVWIGVNLKARGFIFTGWTSVSPSVQTAATCVNKCEQDWCEQVWMSVKNRQHSSNFSITICANGGNLCEQVWTGLVWM